MWVVGRRFRASNPDPPKLGDAPIKIRTLKEECAEKEASVQRHLGFIDQLLKDKQALTAQCEGLAKQMDDVVGKLTHQ
jgi:hypothetical protein